MHLEALDLTVVAIYAILLMVIAHLVSREKAGHSKDTSDYFLARQPYPFHSITHNKKAADHGWLLDQFGEYLAELSTAEQVASNPG